MTLYDRIWLLYKELHKVILLQNRVKKTMETFRNNVGIKFIIKKRFKGWKRPVLEHYEGAHYDLHPCQLMEVQVSSVTFLFPGFH